MQIDDELSMVMDKMAALKAEEEGEAAGPPEQEDLLSSSAMSQDVFTEEEPKYAHDITRTLLSAMTESSSACLAS